MSLRERVETASTVTLALCAMVVSGLFLKRELTPPPDPRAPKLVKQWQEYATGQKTIGPRDAPITVVAFSDFECPYCQRMASILDSLTSMYPKQVQVVFRHFPLTAIHPQALPAAIAAECAANQGRFGEYHDILFAAQDSLGQRPWAALAAEVNVPDLPTFSSCLENATTGQQIAADTLAGRKLGITGTPTIMINGWLFAGTPSLEQMGPTLSKLGLSARPRVTVSTRGDPRGQEPK